MDRCSSLRKCNILDSTWNISMNLKFLDFKDMAITRIQSYI